MHRLVRGPPGPLRRSSEIYRSRRALLAASRWVGTAASTAASVSDTHASVTIVRAVGRVPAADVDAELEFDAVERHSAVIAFLV